MKSSVLIIDNGSHVGHMLRKNLNFDLFHLFIAKNTYIAMEKINREKPNMCIINNTRGSDHFKFVQKIRKIDLEIQITILSSNTDKNEIIKWYKAGIDDYLIKPFDFDINCAKINNKLQKIASEISAKDSNTHIIKGGSLELNYEKRTLTYHQKLLKNLSKTETKLLKLLMMNQNEIVSRELAMKTIWSQLNSEDSKSIDVYINKLRNYLKGITEVKIITIWKSGYSLFYVSQITF